MANGKLSYWKQRISKIKEEIRKTEAELASIVGSDIEQTEIIGAHRRFFGRKTIEHQLKYWNSELDKAKKALIKRAKFVVNWNESKLQYEKDILEYKKRIEEIKIKSVDVLSKITAGQILREENEKFIKEFPIKLQQLQTTLAKYENLLELHLIKKPRDSYSEAQILVDDLNTEKLLAKQEEKLDQGIIPDKPQSDPEVLEALKEIERKKIEKANRNKDPIAREKALASLTTNITAPISDVSFLFEKKNYE